MATRSHNFPSQRAYAPPRRSMMSSLTSHMDPVIVKHIRRVYNALTSALLVASLSALVAQQLIARGVYWPATLCSFGVLPSLWYFSSLSEHSPRRWFAFHLFAAVDGAAVAPLLRAVMDVDPVIAPLALLGATLVFACCSVSALFAKRKSYLFLGSFLFTALVGMCAVSMIAIWWPSVIPLTAYLYFGLMMFCGFVLYDTQLMIEKAHAGDRDHLRHALTLFIDLAALVRHVMVIMANNRARRQREQRRDNKSRS